MMPSLLSIRQLELHLHLGWTDEEKIQAQKVLVDIVLGFAQAPKACESDNLQDTFCYSTLIDHIRQTLVNQKFNLIEHLSYEIYKITKAFIPFPVTVHVTVTKHPPVKGLAGGIGFSYGE